MGGGICWIAICRFPKYFGTDWLNGSEERCYMDARTITKVKLENGLDANELKFWRHEC